MKSVKFGEEKEYKRDDYSCLQI